ncbi:MAG: extensin family protein, partial [Pseudomonadota bacterium]
ADRWLGSHVVKVRVASSYGCRPINHKRGGKLSEHGRANAIDISAFELADGRIVNLKRGWRGPKSERRFLRTVHRGACNIFTTVLGPNADRFHHDHFHFDLARHGRTGTYRVCR